MTTKMMLEAFVRDWVRNHWNEIRLLRETVFARGQADGTPVERVYLHLFSDMQYLVWGRPNEFALLSIDLSLDKSDRLVDAILGFTNALVDDEHDKQVTEMANMAKVALLDFEGLLNDRDSNITDTEEEGIVDTVRELVDAVLAGEDGKDWMILEFPEYLTRHRGEPADDDGVD